MGSTALDEIARQIKSIGPKELMEDKWKVTTASVFQA
jgi:hypothetical protein